MEKRNNFNRMMAAFMALVITVTYTPAPVSVYAKELDNIVTEQEEPEVITIDQGEDVLEEDEIITAEPEGLEDIIIEPMEDESTLAPETEIYEPEVSENIILEPETDGTIIDIDIESEISPEYSEGVTSWKGLQELINDAAYGDTITLSSDIVCDNGKSIKVDGDDVKNITIDLNGHKMDRNRTSSDGDGHVINVKDKATLILKDSVGTGILTGGYATDGGGIKIEKDSTCIIDGNVTISGNKASKDGGGIYAWGTLSMNGGIIAGNEAEIKRANDLGFEIANHTWTHPDMTKLSADQMKQEINKCADARTKITGKTDFLIRPPFLAVNDTFKQVAGVPLVCCSVYSMDWEGATKDQIVNTITSKMADGTLNGQVVLVHENYETTAQAMEYLAPYMKAQGWQIVTVSEMFKANGKTMYNGVVYNGIT